MRTFIISGTVRRMFRKARRIWKETFNKKVFFLPFEIFMIHTEMLRLNPTCFPSGKLMRNRGRNGRDHLIGRVECVTLSQIT